MSKKKVIVVTGPPAGSARSLCAPSPAPGTVDAGIRATAGRNAAAAPRVNDDAERSDHDLRAIELDVASQQSVDAAVAQIVSEHGRLDVVVHNAGHMVLGSAEAFMPERLVAVYHTNVLGARRVNRAALPHLRARRAGLVVRVGITSTRRRLPTVPRTVLRRQGGHGRARRQLRGRAHPVRDRHGHRRARGLHIRHEPLRPCRGPGGHRTRLRLRHGVRAAHGRCERPPRDVDPTRRRSERRRGSHRPCRRPVVRHAAAPHHVDPSRDGSEVVSAVADRIRADFFRRIGLGDLLTASSSR